MSRYQDLQATFASLRDAEIGYWEKLVATQKALRRGFSEFLGVDADKPLSESSSFPALYFGGKPSSFGGKSEDDTLREHNELVFTLNVVLDASERTFPPNAIRFRCRTKYVGGRYMFLVEKRDESYTIIDDEDFTPIYEHLYQSMGEILERYKRL